MEKVTVDLDRLKRRGFTETQIAVIRAESMRWTMGFAMQFLLGVFIAGFLAAAAMLDPQLQLFPVWATAVVVAGIALRHNGPRDARAIAHTFGVMGSVALSLYVYLKSGGSVTNVPRETFAIIAATNFAVGAIMANAPLMAIAVIATAPLVGMDTAYGHATYILFVAQPLLTAAVYAVAAMVAATAARATSGRISTMFWVIFGTSLFLANFGLWVGSIWGDRYIGYSSGALALGWALVCIASIALGVVVNKRSVVNVSGIFLAINFYTQWFERLSGHPAELLVASGSGIVVLLVFAYYNRKIFSRRTLAIQPT